MSDLSNIYAECPECQDETLHTVHRGKMSTGKRLIIDAVVECSECANVHHVLIDEGKEIEVPIIVSKHGTSQKSRIAIPQKEVITVGDDFIHQESLVVVTSIESDGRRIKTAPADRIETIWAKWYDKIAVGVSINQGNKTLSKKIWAVPDEEFYVGEVLEVDGLQIALHRFKVEGRTVHKGTVRAADILRIYGTIAAGRRQRGGPGSDRDRKTGRGFGRGKQQRRGTKPGERGKNGGIGRGGANRSPYAKKKVEESSSKGSGKGTGRGSTRASGKGTGKDSGKGSREGSGRGSGSGAKKGGFPKRNGGGGAAARRPISDRKKPYRKIEKRRDNAR